MAENLEDDYWNTSFTSRFDFDEEEVNFTFKLSKQNKNNYFQDSNKLDNSKTKVTAESIFNKHIEECTALPMHTIISKKNLELSQ